MNRKNGQGGVRLIAVVLIGSGILTVAISIWLFVGTAVRAPWLLPLSSILLAVSAWSGWTGVGLWKAEPWAYKSATILFAAQMPVISVPGFFYQYYSGMNLAVMFEQASDLSKIGFRLNFGALFQFHIGHGIQTISLGLNLIPVLMLIYLETVRERKPLALAATD